GARGRGRRQGQRNRVRATCCDGPEGNDRTRRVGWEGREGEGPRRHGEGSRPGLEKEPGLLPEGPPKAGGRDTEGHHGGHRGLEDREEEIRFQAIQTAP